MSSSIICICRNCFYNYFVSACRCYFKCSFGFYFCIVFAFAFDINSCCTNFCTVNYIINLIVFISLKSLSINYNIEIRNNNSTCVFILISESLRIGLAILVEVVNELAVVVKLPSVFNVIVAMILLSTLLLLAIF